MSVYAGKFDYTPWFDNENVFAIFVDGWIERGRVLVLSTATKPTTGADKAPWGLATNFVLQGLTDGSKDFTIRDLDKGVYYWFSGVRTDENNITLNLNNPDEHDLATIQLTKSAF